MVNVGELNIFKFATQSTVYRLSAQALSGSCADTQKLRLYPKELNETLAWVFHGGLSF